MKYVIYWSFWLFHSVPCPQQKEYEAVYGKGYNCLVNHMEGVRKDTSIFYYNRASAYYFYKQKMIEYWKQEVTVMDADTGVERCAFLFPGIENIKIDSINIK